MKKEIEGIVDISDKKLVKRIATATGQLELSQQSIDAIKANQVKKGNVIEASTIAAIQAVKETRASYHTATRFLSKDVMSNGKFLVQLYTVPLLSLQITRQVSKWRPLLECVLDFCAPLTWLSPTKKTNMVNIQIAKLAR